ncbi:MAG TPA: hypothetical protein PK473_03075 [Nitrosomonas sp.]|nr:hypothetical protein [Agitococcus sp.]HNA69993.1 hypothetical protein [Nitrosomonas sp.]
MPEDKKKKKEESLYGEEGQKMAEGIEAVFRPKEDEKEETKKASAYLSAGRAKSASSYLKK